MIRFACANNDCRKQHLVPENQAGTVVACTECKLPIRVPMLPKELPVVPKEGILLDEPTGAIVTYYQDAIPTKPQTARIEPARATPMKDERTRERCFDCGARIYESELVRRDVKVGSSYVPSDGDPNHFGRSVSHYARVSLCGLCNKARNDADRMVGIVILVVIGIVGSFVLCGGLVGRNSRSREIDPAPPVDNSARRDQNLTEDQSGAFPRNQRRVDDEMRKPSREQDALDESFRLEKIAEQKETIRKRALFFKLVEARIQAEKESVEAGKGMGDPLKRANLATRAWNASWEKSAQSLNLTVAEANEILKLGRSQGWPAP